MFYQQRSAPPPGGEPDEFVLSDATVDRMGDVVEPSGWQLDRIKSDPVVLFNHDKDQIVGKWTDVRVKNGKLIGKIVWAKSDKWPMAQYIRDLVREGILRTVSVGFRALEKEPITKDADDRFGPFRFTKSELLECSLVSVPANPNALAIAKDLPRDLIAEVFCVSATEGFDRSRAVHGMSAAKFLETKRVSNMTTLSQRIVAAQQEWTVLREALNELSSKEDHTTEDAKRYDELPDKIAEAKAELEKHLRVERAMADSLLPVTTQPIERATPEIPMPKPEPDARPALTMPSAATTRVYAAPKKKLEGADLMIRSLACWTKAEGSHERDLGKALRDMYGSDEMTGQVLRAVTNPARTDTATWAAELVDTSTVGFLDRLIPQSIYTQLAAAGVKYTFGTSNQLKIPVRTAVATGAVGSLAGNWVGEGGAKPVRRASFATVSLVPTKLAVISTFTEEMATYSPYAIEGIIRQGMADDTSIALDSFLIDNVVGSALRPAGLLYGVTPITPSALTPATSAMVADLKNLVGAIATANGGRKVVVMMNPAQALQLGFAQTTTGDFLFADRSEAGSKFGVSFIVSNTVPAARLIAVDAEDFATATGDSPKFAVSTDATLHEEDTTPLPLATGPQGTGVLATPMRSLFQTDAVAVRMTLYVSWVMRRASMVQTISPVIW